MKNLEKLEFCPLGASFRDPAGCVFNYDGAIYRYISPNGLDDYEQLMQSGLYEDLVKQDLLIAHEEVETPIKGDLRDGLYIRLRHVAFISIPMNGHSVS